jgi:hypothetical protein
MKHRLVLLGLMLCAVLWAGCNSGGNPSEATSAGPMAKLQAAVTGQNISSAMQKATSWRMSTKTADLEMTMDVVCPDKMHSESKTHGMTMEMIRIGDDMYSKMGAKWTRMPAIKQPPVCGNTATTSGGANSRVPTFDPNIKMTKGATETVNGESCTDWNGSMTDSKGGTRTWTVCIGNDGLPRMMKNGDATIYYSNWNKPATIEAPKM